MDEVKKWYDCIREYPEIEPKKIEIRPSLIEGAGDGVFALEPIREGELIAEYDGYFMGNDVSVEEANISFNIGEELVLVGDNIAAKINDNCKFEPIPDSEAYEIYRTLNIPRHQDKPINCVFDKHGSGGFTRVFVYATRNIEPGEELYLDYGPYYWLSRFISNGLVNKEKAAEGYKARQEEEELFLRENIYGSDNIQQNE